jgi:NAD(P)-dependent dehydrogenase (short-subunit alcohol dehydrogenase family)
MRKLAGWNTHLEEVLEVVNGRIALVTGAYKGIGYEIARQLAAKRLHVFVGARKVTEGKQAAESIAAGGRSAEFIEIDVTNPESIQAAARAVASRVDHLDVLVNNAGILDDTKGIDELDDDTFLQTLATNTLGPIRVTQAFLPLLKRGSGASIINVSSGMGQLSEMGETYPAYSISKTALNAVTRQFAAVLRDQGITVNSVCPGWVKTDMGGPEAPRTVEEGAETVTWLATEGPRELTGQFLRDRQTIPW